LSILAGKLAGDFPFNDGAVCYTYAVAPAWQKATERHPSLPAYAFEPFKLGKGLDVVVNTQIEVRPLFLAIDEKRSRLLAALITASGLAGQHCCDQPARKWQGSTRKIGTYRFIQDTLAGKHIPGNGKSIAGDMPTPVDARRAGMRRDPAARVHQVNLAVVATVVGRDQRFYNRLRRLAFAQKPQAIRAVKGIDQRLRCNGTDACGNERHPGT
jgi:hypothetical protein